MALSSRNRLSGNELCRHIFCSSFAFHLCWKHPRPSSPASQANFPFRKGFAYQKYKGEMKDAFFKKFQASHLRLETFAVLPTGADGFIEKRCTLRPFVS